MDGNKVYPEALNVTTMAKRWNQLGLFKKVYAQTLIPEKIPNDESNTSSSVEEKEKTDVVKNSDEYFKMKLQDPKLKQLVDTDVSEHLKKETGWDRLKIMYTKNELNEWSTEVMMSGYICYCTGAMTFMVGGILGARAGAERFVMKNQHTAFDTKFIALRKYNDSVYFGGVRLGLQLGLRAGLLSYLFMMSSQSIAAYRNKSSVLDYAGAGGITCSILRLSGGWRAMVAGGVIGSLMGLLVGVVAYPLLRVAGFTQEERHNDYLVKRYISEREFDPLESLPAISKTDVTLIPSKDKVVT